MTPSSPWALLKKNNTGTTVIQKRHFMCLFCILLGKVIICGILIYHFFMKALKYFQMSLFINITEFIQNLVKSFQLYLSGENSIACCGDESHFLHCIMRIKNIYMYKQVGVDIMARPRTNNVQINITLPGEWKKQLKNL